MQVEIQLALLSSAVSAGTALWGLLTARSARARALVAEEIAGRSEQIRLKALDAGSTILGALVKYIVGIETAIQMIGLKGGLTEGDAAGVLGPVGNASFTMRRAVLENAIFLSPSIVGGVERLVSKMSLSPAELPDRLRESKDLHGKLVQLFQRTYLTPATADPHSLALQLSASSPTLGRRS